METGIRSRIGLFSDKVIEAGWLLAAVLTPLHFNVYTNRTFEPDKISLLRSLAVFVCAAWIIRFLEGNGEAFADGSTTGVGAHGAFSRKQWLPFLRTPLVIPVLLFFLAYLLSAVLSVLPGLSFVGSYSRLQGVYSISSYIVFFLAVVACLRGREQLDRLVNTLILTSLPAALYGIIQHYGLDPISWSMNMVDRPGANMGNPIFLAAYLIMVMPITLFKAVESFPSRARPEKKRASKLRIALFSTYVFAALSQFISILFTQSRGPWLGMFVGLSFFILTGLIMLRSTEEGGGQFTLRDAGNALLFSVCGLLTLFVPAYLLMLYRKKGFRWLWLAFVFQIMFVAVFIVLLNIHGSALAPLRNAPYIGRLGHLSEAESGTAKVRAIIWRGTADLIGSNPLRMIIGYGPETMKYVWDAHSPPELAHYEARNAAPDRSHNETYDLIVTTGFIGFFMYMALIGSILYFSLKWLGFIENRKQALLFAVLCGAGVVAGILLPRLIGGGAFTCVGIPAGLISALFAYVVVSPVFKRSFQAVPGSFFRRILILALLSGIVAHYTEIHTGISIASTRLYFFLYAALLAVMGLGNAWEEEAPARATPADAAHDGPESATTSRPVGKKQKKRSPVSPSRETGKKGRTALTGNPVLTWSVIAASVLMTAGFGFILNAQGETDPVSIIWSAFSTITVNGETRGSAALFLLLSATYAAGLVFILETVRQGLVFSGGKAASAIKGSGSGKTRLLEAAGIYTALTLLVPLAGMLIQASYALPDSDPGKSVIFYYVAQLVLLLAVAFTLPRDAEPAPGLSRRYGIWLYPLVGWLAIFAVFAINVRPIKADAYEKVAISFENRQQWDESIRFHDRAIALAPHEDFYYLCLGRTLFGKIATLPPGEEKEALFTKIYETMNRAHEINPLNTDHLANLGLLFLRWAESDPLKEGRRQKLKKAHRYYEMAVQGSPRKIIIINSWAKVYAAEADFGGALTKLRQSLAVDDKAAITYFSLGDLYAAMGRIGDAEAAYRRGIDLEPENAEALASLGHIYYKEGKIPEAEKASLNALSKDPKLVRVHSLLSLIYYTSGRVAKAVDENLKIVQVFPGNAAAHHNLSIIYEQTGQIDKAVQEMERVVALSPASARTALAPELERLRARSGHPSLAPGKP